MVNIDDDFYSFVEFSIRELSVKHNVTMPVIDYNNRKKSLGRAFYTQNKIEISLYNARINQYCDIYNTILHEFAHLLAFRKFGISGTGHCELFYDMCNLVGATPARCHNSEENVIRATKRNSEQRLK